MNGEILTSSYEKLLSDRTKIVAFSGVVNTTGVVNPSKQIIEMAHKVGLHAYFRCCTINRPFET